MPNTIKYSTTGDTQSLRKGNFYIGVGDVPKGPSSRTDHWQGITPPISGYTIYINSGSGSTAIMVPENDSKLVEYANGMNNNTNYFSNGGNFSNGAISPFNSLYNQVYGTSYVVNIANDKPYSGSNSNYAMFFNYGGGRMMGTDGMLKTGVTYTFSFWAKLVSGTTMNISWNNQNGSGETNAWTSSATLTTEWKRYIQTFTYNLPRTRFYFYTANPSNPERAAIFTEFQVSTGTTYGGPGLQNATEALRWFSDVSQDEVCVNRDYESIVTSGLTMLLDAGFTPSYTSSGTTWYDLAYSGYNNSLVNGLTYGSQYGGGLVFDNTNDYIQVNTIDLNAIGATRNYTICFSCIKEFIGTGGNLVGNSALIIGGANGYNSGWRITENNGGTPGSPFSGRHSFTHGAPTITNQLTVNDGVAIHRPVYLCFSINTGTTFGYCNGSYVSGVTGSYVNGSTYGTIGLGAYGVGYWGGKIYNYQLYNRSLSLSEVKQNYLAYLNRFVGKNIVTNGLTLYLDAGYRGSYPTSGTTWADIGGNNLNGTLTNGPTYSSSNEGVIDFDGTNDFVNCQNILNFIYADAFTTESWINWDGGVQPNNAGHIIGKTYGNYRTLLLTDLSLGYVSFRLDSNGQVTNTSRVIVPNEWYHIVSSWDPTTFTAKVYVNGVELSSTTNTSTDWTYQGANFQIGNSPGENYYFNGKIALGRVYNKTLSQAEVLQNFNAQKSRFGL